jgi:hypothetical protein
LGGKDAIQKSELGSFFIVHRRNLKTFFDAPEESRRLDTGFRRYDVRGESSTSCEAVILATALKLRF